MRGRPRQPGVAEDELHPLDRQAERLGRDLRHRGPGARPHVARGARHLGGAVGQEARHGRGRRVVHRVGGGRHAPADQPAAVAHRARLGIAPAPAEALGGDPVAFPRRAARERQLLELVLLRLVAQAQLDRVDVQRHRELVHGGFEREVAAHLAGGAHIGRRVHVHAARGDGACRHSGTNAGTGSRSGAPPRTPRRWRSPGSRRARSRRAGRRARRRARRAGPCAGGSRRRNTSPAATASA